MNASDISFPLHFRGRDISSIGFPRTVKPKGGCAIVWNDLKDMTEVAVVCQITDKTVITGPIKLTISYVDPFIKCDHEKDYEQACAALFAEEGGCNA